MLHKFEFFQAEKVGAIEVEVVYMFLRKPGARQKERWGSGEGGKGKERVFGPSSYDAKVFWKGCCNWVDFLCCFLVGIRRGGRNEKGFSLCCDVALQSVHVG